MAYFNVNRKGLTILILLLLSLPLFSNKLFYLSTDRTYAVDELKRVKVESGSLNEVKIRVYKINDTKRYFLSQDDFHRPKVKGRKFRYVTPDVIKGFKNYLKTELRGWSRENMPGQNRKRILKKYKALQTTSNELYYSPSKQVDYINDENFTLVDEKKYVFERRSNNWNTNYVYFNALKPGTYLIEGITGDKLAYTVLNVSPFSFITKKAGDQIQLFSVNNSSGEPLANISYTIYDRFRNEIAKAKSDSDGLTTLNIEHDEIFIVANDEEGSYSFYDPRYYPSAVSDRTVYLYSDRPVYKGGDLISFKGIVRDIDRGKYNSSTATQAKVSIWSNGKNISGDIALDIDQRGSFFGNYKLPEGVVSGLYKLKAIIDEKEYEAEFKVEYYIKPEFKVVIKADKKTYLTGEEIKFDIKGEFYHGDPVQNLEVNYVISRTRYSQTNVDRGDLGFYLSSQEWVYTGVERLSSGTTTLDSSGLGVVNFTVERDAIKGNTPYTYMLTATVKNRGGSDVTAGGSARVVPTNLRIGLSTHKFVYLLDERVTLNMNVTDYDSSAISTDLDIKIFSKSGGDKKLIKKESVKSDNKGLASIEFEVDEAGYVVVEVTGADHKGNIVTSEKAVWIGEEGATYSVSGGFVKLVLDRSYYGTKDNAQLLVVSPIANIPMLLTIEGTEIYSSKVIRLKENSSLLSIPIKDKYLPNAFITVDFIYENRHYSNTIKLDIPPVEKFLDLKIEPEEESFAPETKGKVLIKVSDSDGQPVESSDISVAVVDEAVYGISEDLSVDIRKFFYHFRRNNVMTWTSSGFRFYGYAYNVRRELAGKYYKDATGIASFKGGDDEEEEERKDFKDSILWIPNLKTDSNGEVEVEIDFPSNITSWRITAVANDKNHRFGVTRENVITKKDLFTKLSLPKTVGEYDESTIFVNIHNNSFSKKSLTLKRSLENLDGDISDIEIEIPANKSHIFAQKIVSRGPGLGSFEVKITEEGRVHDIIKKDITVTHHSLEKSLTLVKTLSKDENEVEFNKPLDLKRSGAELNISFMNSYAGHINDSLKYLALYPHGCVEQTTNKFLPNVAVVSAFNKAGIKLNGMDQKLQNNITEGINKLSSYQNSDGSWGWWQDGDINLFMTSYVLYALSMANNLYYTVNHTTLDKGLKFLEENIHMGSTTEKLYAVYVLSLNGNRIESVYNSFDPDSLSDYELALLLLTAHSYSDGNKIDEIVPILESRGQTESVGRSWGQKGSVQWQYDSIETTAWVLRALAPHSESEVLYSIADYLISQKRGDRWKSTRDTSAAIMAIADITPRINSGVKISTVLFNGEIVKEIKLSSSTYSETIKIDRDKIENHNTFKVLGLDDDIVTANLNFKYFTDEKDILPGSAGASITRKYYSLVESGESYSLGSEISSVDKGENFLVELTYSQEKVGEYVMITDNFPGGATYNKNINILDISGISGSFPEAVDPRYGKIHFYSTQSGDKKIYYALKANYPGSYKVSPAIGELMYFPEFRGNSNSNTFTIRGEK